MVRRGNPNVDLAYFFGTSTSPEMRKDHLDQLLGFYYDKLDSNLTLLGYPRKMYPFDLFLRDFKHSYFIGIILGSLHGMVTRGQWPHRTSCFIIFYQLTHHHES